MPIDGNGYGSLEELEEFHQDIIDKLQKLREASSDAAFYLGSLEEANNLIKYMPMEEIYQFGNILQDLEWKTIKMSGMIKSFMKQEDAEWSEKEVR